MRAALLAAFALVMVSRAAEARLFEAEEFTLANGLDVVVVPNHRAPIVTQMVWYKVGAADEIRGKTGIAHFLEHLMFRGTKETPPGAFSRIVADNGGRDNAFTTSDYTAFFQNVAADRLELVMRLEAERMSDLVLTDAVVLPERNVIIEERHSRIDNNPSALLNEQVEAALYLNSAYHNPTIGWEHEMRGLTTEDALAFYRTWYAPNNAILIVAGDADAAQVKALAEKYYGPIPAKKLPTRRTFSEPPKVAAIHLAMKSPRVSDPSWSRSYLAPSYTSPTPKARRLAYALQVLAEVLGGGASSLLYKSLVVDQGVALAAGAFYDPNLRGSGQFGFYAAPKKDMPIADFESSIEAVVKEALDKGISADEVERAKKRMQTQAIFAQDGISGPARTVGGALAIGRSLADVQSWPDRIGAVTVDEVNEAARLVIRDDVGVTGVLLPKPTS
jgi:zinc protease